MKLDKQNYKEYREERRRREQEVEDLWIEYRKLKKKIEEITDKLHQDYPETRGEDPGY